MDKFLMAPEPQTIIQILVFYGLLTMFVYFLSDFLMFPVPKSSYQDSHEIIKLTTRDGKKISAFYKENPAARYTLLISHGNAEDIGSIRAWVEAFYQQGFSVLAYDYHGYGTSQGRPSEFHTYLDIEAAYRFLVADQKIPADRIILLGRSIGTGPTLELASKVKVAGIILESPFLSAFRVLTVIPLFPVDRFRNNQKILNIQTPILIIHGTQDRVIPFWHSSQLYELAKPPKRFFAVEGASHNDVVEVGGQAYWQAVQSFARALPVPKR